jgi:glycosyltransferase involved in cell wall biosynthesis
MENKSFRNQIEEAFDELLKGWNCKIPDYDSLRIDLHCHDGNSDVPDELWGRILHLPETWLSTSDLVDTLRPRTNTLTITNHNNARSCWALQDKGIDVLPAAEFTVFFEDMKVATHVLTYGFSRAQEPILDQRRTNGYAFLEYCKEQKLPTILAHPLFLQHEMQEIPMDVFERFALLFERFEVLNGQRDAYQNLLVNKWVESLTEEKIRALGQKHGIDPFRFCEEPFRKRVFGGSDDHFSFFVGLTGTRLHVPNLALRLKTKNPSELALEAIRSGETAPFGSYVNDEKLTIGFMDYFCQVALKMKEPGLLRMLLHRGTLQDKLMCFAISNMMQEMRRHKYTTNFLSAFHEALLGNKPGLLMNLSISKDYRPLLEDVELIAEQEYSHGDQKHIRYIQAVDNMFLKMMHLIAKRIQKQKDGVSKEKMPIDLEDFVRRFEVPSYWRSWGDLPSCMDQLSFPMLAAVLMLGARFAGTRIMNNDRLTVRSLAAHLGEYQMPKRTLWLTDTLEDKNGVASVLRATLKEIQRRDLPIDILLCSNSTPSEPHLHVVPSLGNFALKTFSDHEFNVPNILDIQKIFADGSYDRVMVSTEFCMGPVALYLQKAFNVPAYLFMHTDWVDYIKTTTHLDAHNQDRIRRLLRAFYQQFNGIFVLNSEHESWLQSPTMGISKERIFKTAHWNESFFKPTGAKKLLDPQAPVFLFVGRLSEEKGVLELPLILHKIQETIPQAKLKIAGTGVAEEKLKSLLPEAEFLGWVDHTALPKLYSEVDMLLLPSRFDTFGCVVTEAMSCGLPVAAYDSKGPKDIISHEVDGLLAPDAESLATAIVATIQRGILGNMYVAALKKAGRYDAEEIMDRIIADLG